MVKKNSGPFVTQIDLSLAEKLRVGVVDQGFELSQPAHTIFQARKPGVTCTLYNSGKLVLQGSGIQEFIEFYLEPEILGTFTYSHPTADVDLTPRIGSDEAGKGDFFGPLCIAGCHADEAAIQELVKLGIADSKKLSDGKMGPLSDKIEKICTVESVVIMPAKYNELYAKFKNLNTMLAWGHATVLANLYEKTGCRDAIVDQFAYPHVMENAVERKGIELNLTQRVRAESDIVVAAASIVARIKFVRGLEGLSRRFNTELPKGANNGIIKVGKGLVERHGPEILSQVAKLHFKTTDQILS